MTSKELLLGSYVLVSVHSDVVMLYINCCFHHLLVVSDYSVTVTACYCRLNVRYGRLRNWARYVRVKEENNFIVVKHVYTEIQFSFFALSCPVFGSRTDPGFCRSKILTVLFLNPWISNSLATNSLATWFQYVHMRRPDHFETIFSNLRYLRL